MNIRFFFRRRMVLVLTMIGMALVLTQRTADLARSAMAMDKPGAATTPAAPTVKHANKEAPAPVPLPASVPVPVPVPASRPPSPSPTAATDFGLLAELQHRRQALDVREAKLNSEAQMVDAAEARLRERLDELNALQAKLETLRQQQQKEDVDRWGNLVKVYAEMKPKDAAAIFDLLDPQTMTEVLERMDDRKASGILAAMTPDRARFATQLLARRRADSPTTTRSADASGTPNPG